MFDPTTFGKTTYTMNSTLMMPQMSRTSYNPDVNAYIQNFEVYPALAKEEENIYFGWAVSILKKDGTWDIIDTYPSGWESIPFSYYGIKPENVANYSRSSDGYLRCKITRFACNYYSPNPSEYFLEYANYLLLDYLPQKPQMAFSKVMSQTRTVDDEYYADVKISFKNVEGTERILVEQLEEGANVPFTYYVENVKDGYFIASVDKEYKTTFRLRAINKNGETISDQMVINPLVKPVLTFNPIVNGDILDIEFVGSRNDVVEKGSVDYKIWDLKTTMIQESGKTDDNKVDISQLRRGVYGVQVVDEEGNAFSAKFMK